MARACFLWLKEIADLSCFCIFQAK